MQLITTCTGCAVVVFVLAGSGPAFGQPRVLVPSAVTVGATVGGGLNGNSWSGGGQGPVLSMHVDLPAADSLRVRFAVGATRWTPTNEPLEGGEPAGRVSFTHVTASALFNYIQPTLRFPVGIYWGAGVGTYRYRIEHGSFRSEAIGLHGIGGIEYVDRDRHFAVRLETVVHMAGGPRHRQVWATSVPALSAAVGISRRF
jgi:hypothetical protein